MRLLQPAARPPARRRPSVLLLTALLALAVAASVAMALRPAAAGASSPAAVTRSGAVHAAADYAHRHGYRIAISVIDTETGKLYHAGSHDSHFATESVVKVMIAARLIHQNRLHGSTKARAYKMITQSDDSIASSFYGSVGGDNLINWVKSYYRIPDLGSPPHRAGWWGNTHITSDGMATLYEKLKANHKVARWLIPTMHDAHEYGSDGFYQWFGLHQAYRHAAIKQGWGVDDDTWSHADENTTGYVDDDRYAVVILGSGPLSTYGSKIGAMLSQTAKILLPGGRFPEAAPHITSLDAHSGRTSGGTPVTLSGDNLAGTDGVLFGTHHATGVRVLSDHRVQVTAPWHSPGAVRLVVETTHGRSTPQGPRFTYVAAPTVTSVTPAQGPTAGGTRITVRGTDLARTEYVVLGGVHATVVGTPSDTELTAVTPANVAGRMHVRVRTSYGLSDTGPQNAFTYLAPSAPRRLRVHGGAGSSAARGGTAPGGAAPSGTVPAGTTPGGTPSTGGPRTRHLH